MSAQTGMSVEEYLHTSFPGLDREYRDGELVERSSPDYLHGKTQAVLVAFFFALRSKFPVFPAVETRVKIRTGLYLIPDVSVFFPTEPSPLPENPPLIAIEVLSEDDRLSAVRKKLQEYRDWGVPHVWLVDTRERRFYTCDRALVEVERFEVPELALEILPSSIFD
jgi:Uma2 family endonuclease